MLSFYATFTVPWQDMYIIVTDSDSKLIGLTHLTAGRNRDLRAHNMVGQHTYSVGQGQAGQDVLQGAHRMRLGGRSPKHTHRRMSHFTASLMMCPSGAPGPGQHSADIGRRRWDSSSRLQRQDRAAARKGAGHLLA